MIFAWAARLKLKMWEFGSGAERSRERRKATSHSPSIIAWRIASNEKVVGPYFFEDENVNGKNYRNILIHYAFPRFRSSNENYVLLQDHAATHYSSRTRIYLANKMLNNGIGRGAPVQWPIRSPYLTPCDFLVVPFERKVIHYTSRVWRRS